MRQAVALTHSAPLVSSATTGGTSGQHQVLSSSACYTHLHHHSSTTPFSSPSPGRFTIHAMNILDISTLNLDEPPPHTSVNGHGAVHIPDDIAHTTDRYMLKLQAYAKSIPYSIESNSQMQEMFEFILYRITQCVEAKDYDPGLVQWDSMVT